MAEIILETKLVGAINGAFHVPPTNEDTVGGRKRSSAYWTMYTPMAIRITASSLL